MKINVLILAIIMSSFGAAIGQNGNFWTETSESSIPSKKSPKDLQQPLEPRFFKLDFKDLKRALKDAPMEYTNYSKELIISFPIDDGTIERFEVVEAPVMAPGLAAKYPNIKSYRGMGLDNPLNSIHFNYSLNEFYGSIHTSDGMIYIDPYTEGKGEFSMVYNISKMTEIDESMISTLSCGVTSDMVEEMGSPKESTALTRSIKIPALLKVYRFALGCTGEYASLKGGTLEAVNAAFVTAMSRVNQIFQLEVGVKLELIEDNDRLINLDGATDPYENPTIGAGLLGQTFSAFTAAGVFQNTYDLGQVFTVRCTDGIAGVVSGRACVEDTKMRGVTCDGNAIISNGTVSTMAHEVAHQFSCAHSWDNCPNSAPQRAPQAAFEPGSGTTIMSYQGACGDQNLSGGGNNEYYNIGSLQSFISYTRTTFPNCGEEVSVGNNYPTVEVPYEDGFYIPARTPFELTAIASDEDGDALTYCWEQRDNEITASTLGEPMGNAPIMRSRPPTTDPTRLFPNRTFILANISSSSETLPTYDRDMTFFCTVRDNAPEGGGTVWDGLSFKVDGESGPFRLSFPSNTNDELTAGENVEFRWDPANSQNAPVNCKAVDFLISYDNGGTFIDTLARDIVNDGSYFVTIPERASSSARIKIAAAENIFFDYSNSQFSILEANAPTYTISIPEYRQVCAPEKISFDIFTSSVLDFDNPVELSLIGDIPSVISNVNFVNNGIIPGEQSRLELTIDQPVTDMTIDLLVQAISQDADTTIRAIQLDLLTTDFSSLTLDGPLDGVSGVSSTPDFFWSSNINATSFNLEIATSPDFNEASIFESVENLAETSYSLDKLLEVTTLYYWRVTPINGCSIGEPSIPSAFHTESFACQDIDAQGLPLVISQSFSGDLESSINVTQSGNILDLNITNLTGSHTDFSDLSFSVQSPSGTIVKLVSNKCFAQSTSFDLSFDQESPFSFTCPPNNVFIPQESLDAFIGENSEGTWKLLINDRTAQNGGSVESWSLEFCSLIELSNLSLTRNNGLQISENYEKIINNSLLRVEDGSSPDWELLYTLVQTPKFGTLQFDGTVLAVGDQFTQDDVNKFKLSYLSNASVGESDNFLFTVVNANGAWTGTHSYEIEFVDQNVSANDLKTIQVEVFPNPTKDLLFVKTSNNFSLVGNMEVYNLQGQLMIQKAIRGNVRETINTAPLGNGIYFLKIQDGEKYSISKFVVER